MIGTQTIVFRLRESEDRCDPAEIGVFFRGEATVSPGNLEQRAHQILKHGSFTIKQSHNLAGIAFSTGGTPPRHVEEEIDIGALFGRYGKDPVKRGNFALGDGAVGLRHFRGKRDDGDGEANLFGGGRTRLALHLGHHDPGTRLFRSEQAVPGQFLPLLDNALPDAHDRILADQSRRIIPRSSTTAMPTLVSVQQKGCPRLPGHSARQVKRKTVRDQRVLWGTVEVTLTQADPGPGSDIG